MEDREYQAMFEVEKTHWWFVARRMFVSRVLEIVVAGPADRGFRELQIADIGAGTGGMEPFLRRYGNVFGIEPNPKGRTLAKKRGIILQSGTATHTGLGTSSMNLVCFFDVLYHKGVDDHKALTEAYRILQPGGWLVITDIAMPWLAGPHDTAVSGRQRYMLSSLTRKVEQAGFTLQRKSYIFFAFFPLFAIKRLIDRLFFYHRHDSDVRPVSRIVNGILTWACRLEAYLFGYISYPWGSSLLILARKS